MKRFIIIGLGNFGSSAAEKLTELGHDVATLDRDERAVERIADHVTQAAVGDGTDPETLQRIGADDADAAIVSTGDDITASVLAALALRDAGVPEVYVKVISRSHARVMEKLGVTETIFPERESAQRLARRIASKQVVNYFELGPGFAAQEIAVPREWVGKSLRELALPRHHRVSVIAVHDFLTSEFRPVPDPDAVLKDSDALLMAGTDESLTGILRLGKEE
jgi:trk system potassium uptake protein TrkA